MRGSHHCVDGAQRAPTVCVVYMAAPAGHRTTSATARPPHIHALRTPHGLARFTMREGGRACSSLTRPRARLLEGWRQESIAPGSTPPPARSIVPAPSTVASMHLAPLPLHEREGGEPREHACCRLLPRRCRPPPSLHTREMGALLLLLPLRCRRRYRRRRRRRCCCRRWRRCRRWHRCRRCNRAAQARCKLREPPPRRRCGSDRPRHPAAPCTTRE